jgi:predicted RNA-binding protein YlxR (DUF448 family)
MKTIIAYRNGEEKLRTPAEIRNGVLRYNHNILINNDLIPAGQRDFVKTQLKNGNITPDIEAMGMHIGDNGKGLVVRWADDVEAERAAKAQADYNALPADVRKARSERNAIERLYQLSDKALNHDTDDNNTSRGYWLLAEADDRLKAWRANYPKEAMREDAQDLMSRAVHQDELAAGALCYDADGWISTEDQQRRHDEYKAKAEQLRAEAKRLLEVAK